jgi:hypothetical protein
VEENGSLAFVLEKTTEKPQTKIILCGYAVTGGQIWVRS